MSSAPSVACTLTRICNMKAFQTAMEEVLPYFQQVAHEIPFLPDCVKRGVVFNPHNNPDILKYITPKGDCMEFLDYKGVFNRDDYGYVAFTHSDYVAGKFSGSLVTMPIKNAYNGSIGLKIVTNRPLYNIDAEAVMAAHIAENDVVLQENDWHDGRECETSGWHPDPDKPVVEESDIVYIQPVIGGVEVGLPYVNTRYKPRPFTITTLTGCDIEALELGEAWKKHQDIEPDDEPILPSEAKKMVEVLSPWYEDIETIDLSTAEGLNQLKKVTKKTTRNYRTIKQYYDCEQAQLFLDRQKLVHFSDNAQQEKPGFSTDTQTRVMAASEVAASFFSVSKQDTTQQNSNTPENECLAWR